MPRCIPSLLLIFSLVSSAWANDQAQYQERLEGISKQIEKISNKLNKDKKLLKSEQTQLFEVEQDIASNNKQIKQTNRAIKEQQSRIEQLQKEYEALKKSHSESSDAFAAMVVNQYKRGQSHYLKNLLNQSNPYALGRLDNYYQYYYQSYTDRINQIRSQITAQEAIRVKIQQEMGELAFKQQQLEQRQQALTSKKVQRKSLVTKISNELSASDKKLKKLKADRARLNDLLKQIAEQAEMLRIERERQKLEQQQAQQNKKEQEKQQAKTIVPRSSNIVEGGFNKQKGRLSMPVAGKVKYQFNDRIAESGMRSDGILLDTGQKTNVSAIFKGQVVFADWLKGYGLLLIIDHGDNHLSLYGHNEVLYKKVGDLVASNELISQSGTTGGLVEPGLYFEIRHNAVPVNPDLWCQ